MSVFRIDSTVGKAEKTATGTRIPIYTGAPELKVEVMHGLGRVPLDIWVSTKDKWCDVYVESKDRDRAVVVFSEAKVNLYLRCE